MIYIPRKIRTITVAITMKTITLLLSTLALASAIEWKDLVATWRIVSTDPEHSNSFYPMPETRFDAVSAGWVDAGIEQVLAVDTWCMPDDPRVCMLYDAFGTVAGFQVGESVSDFADMQSIYNMSRINYYKIKTIFDQEVWTSVCWIQNPAVLESLGYCGTWDDVTATEGVWFETTDGYVEIPKDLANLDPMWTKQNCVTSMGTHYYYDLHNTTDCRDFQPWFPLYDGDTLISVGHQAFGKVSMVDRNWEDQIPVDGGVQAVVPEGPQCLYDWPVNYGLASVHVWFVEEPWTITCS